jgi:beta-galactosidase
LEDALILHRHCYRAGIACGFIHPADDLTRLKVLYVPHWVMWKPEWTPQVADFVAKGGTLILSAMTGTRDIDNHIHRQLAPGAGLSELAGVKVVEFGRLVGPGASGLFEPWKDGVNGGHQAASRPDASSASRQYRFTLGNREFTAAHLYEQLELAPGTEALGQWSNRFLQGQTCATQRRHGAGRVIYLGTYLTDELADALQTAVLAPAGVQPLIADLPEGVEVSVRQAQGRALWFITNTTDAPQQVAGAPVGVDLLTDTPCIGALALEPYGCAIIKV